MSGRKALLWGLGLVSVMLSAAGIWHLEAGLYPLRYVRVTGEVQHLHIQEVQQVLQPLLKGYWSVDLGQAEEAVEKLAWVEDALVQRIWPDTLELVIREQVPEVRWGERALLNQRGDMFQPETLQGYRHLPRLKGPENYRRRLFLAYRRMNEALAPLTMRIELLEVDSRRSWQVKLGGGPEIQLGRVSPEATFARLVRAMVRLGKEKCQQIERLDGRYEHGFAVRWQREGKTQGERTLKLEQHG